jgi:hypothetical protein
LRKAWRQNLQRPAARLALRSSDGVHALFGGFAFIQSYA